MNDLIDNNERYSRYTNRPEIVRQDECVTRNVYRCPACDQWSWAVINDWTVDVFHVQEDNQTFVLTCVTRYAWDVYGERHLLNACCPTNFTGTLRRCDDGNPQCIEDTQQYRQQMMALDVKPIGEWRAVAS